MLISPYLTAATTVADTPTPDPVIRSDPSGPDRRLFRIFTTESSTRRCPESLRWQIVDLSSHQPSHLSAVTSAITKVLLTDSVARVRHSLLRSRAGLGCFIDQQAYRVTAIVDLLIFIGRERSGHLHVYNSPNFTNLQASNEYCSHSIREPSFVSPLICSSPPFVYASWNGKGGTEPKWRSSATLPGMQMRAYWVYFRYPL